MVQAGAGSGGGRGAGLGPHERRTGGEAGERPGRRRRWRRAGPGPRSDARTAAAWVGGAARPGSKYQDTGRPGIPPGPLTESVARPAALCCAVRNASPPAGLPRRQPAGRAAAGKPRPALAAPNCNPHKALRRRCLLSTMAAPRTSCPGELESPLARKDGGSWSAQNLRSLRPAPWQG